MTKGARIATYTGSAVVILFVVCLGLIKLSQKSPGPKPHPLNLDPLQVTLYVKDADTKQCAQQVDGVDNNTPEIQEGQGVTWTTALPGWSLSFQNETVIPPNTGSPFEDSTGDWQLNFMGAPSGAVYQASSNPSVLTFWETLWYSFGTGPVPFTYNSLTIGGTQCSSPSNLGLVVHSGVGINNAH